MVRNFCRLIAVILGALHTYAAVRSQSMNADGIAYLDIGDTYFRADWVNAISAVWSPLYSWILGLINFVLNPTIPWTFPVVHMVNFIIYLFALVSFEFMWLSVRKVNTQENSERLSDPLWWVLGYLLFIWTTLSLIQIWSVTPDMLMAGFVFLAAGLIARIRYGDQDKRIFLSLGLVLGLGYLSKSIMFMIALIFLGLAWLVQKRSANFTFRTMMAAGVFLLISLPFILLISNKAGKLTIGEAGTVTYIRHVVGIPYPHWQGDPLQNIAPAHPSRLIHESPPVYEFGDPIGGTYPISTDPAYWYEGIDVRVNLRNLLTPLFQSGFYYLELFFQQQGILVACVMALYIMGRWSKTTLFDIFSRWALVIPAVIAFGLYGMVLVANRYIGVFVMLFWADILANIQLSGIPKNKSWLRVLGGIAAIGLIINIIIFNLDGINRLNPSLAVGHQGPSNPPAKPVAVAQSLAALGLEPGDKVGVIGYAYDSFWARLAGLQIVSELLSADAADLWLGDEALQKSVLEAFSKSGASAVVAEYVPSYAELNNWHQVGNSNYYIHLFTE